MWNEDREGEYTQAMTFKIRKRDVLAALKTSLPIMVTFVVLGAG